MNSLGIMDGCLECIGLPTLPAVPVPAHLESLGRTRLADGSTAMCFVCTTCGLLWAHHAATGWRRTPPLGSASEATRAQSVARFADSV
jgi:hypothetical protein